MNFGSPPPLLHFSNDNFRDLVYAMRQKVAIILSNNLLPHFTDHSVSHSDNVTRLVDKLLDHARLSLNDQELMILYSACYLHDIGMQYGQAGKTNVITSLNLPTPWEQLSNEEKCGLLRDYHHKISAELIVASFEAAQPPIGYQLTSDFEPTYVARLSHAHCVDPTSEEYAELVQEAPNKRISLLSGLLRIADILDESCHRALREKARTIELDIFSQSHWWRHYYTEEVTFDISKRVITVWFAFPEDYKKEYESIIPCLQLPWIEAEFAHHNQVFSQNELSWSLDKQIRSGPYRDKEAMPDNVLTEIHKQLAARDKLEAEKRHLIAVTAYKEAQPNIERRLNSLHENATDLEPADQLIQLSEIAFDLYDLGGKSSSIALLYNRFLKDLHQLSLDVRIEIGSRFIYILLKDKQSHEAGIIIDKLYPDVETLDKNDPRRWRLTKCLYDILVAECRFEDAKALMEDEEVVIPEKHREEIEADIAEYTLLRGELSAE